ncbi:Pentapeptide repeat protein [Vibrio stylophorae]|uniref:Pentapeptide repeat protein n=1 Tax=Vibrio stylophorae TaxID=659351 RepID=A0ABM8ZVB6_9VIBR|nr:Qnr family pentapeptide repeat protein [Vibrio stylophorae]CAH0534253.1 Pentapeptide repeat protein [Vibrio stylophorae]
MPTQQQFIEQDFSEQDFSSQRFEQCTFIRCRFRHCDFSESQFIDCQFIDRQEPQGCDFSYSKLQDASFIHCQLGLCDFTGANCFAIELRQCDLKGANFSRASFANQINNRSYFCSAYITGCNLAYANLEKQVIENCELFENRWLGANLQSASLRGSDLSRGEFSSDVWGQFQMQGCDLSHVELTGLNPKRIDLTGVKINVWQQEQLLSAMGIEVVMD